MCARWWPSVRPFRGDPGVTVLQSARGRPGLARLQRALRGPGRPDGVVLHRSLLGGGTVARLHDDVPLVLTWPVEDTADLAEARAAGVDGVIATDPTVLRLAAG